MTGTLDVTTLSDVRIDAVGVVEVAQTLVIELLL